MKDSKATIQARKIVKAKGPIKAPAKKPALSQAVTVKSAKAAASKKVAVSKKAAAKAAAKEASEGSEEEKDEDMTVQEQSVEMIDTSKRRPAASQPATKKRAPSMPKVGQKRLRKTPKKNLNEDEDEGEEDEEDASALKGEDDDDEEGSSQPVKKRKVGAGKAEKAPKSKKAPKKPTEFKKGKWNPNVELLKLDKYLEHP